MVKEITVTGYEAYKKAVQENSPGNVYTVFYADAEEDKGTVSWCPDCRNCDPILKRNLNSLPEDAVFILCYVGDRPTWKDPNNTFRKEVNISTVPTLMKLGEEKRLEEAQCSVESLVREFFSS